MKFGQHIFIISSDKESLNQTTKDWNSSIYKNLELMLSRLSGQQIKINEISCNDLDVETIYTPHTVLIPILSQELIDSPAFKKEIKLFHNKAINKSHNNISWNKRIFKVLPAPQKDHHVLDFLSDSFSYDFFHFDIDTDKLKIYDDFTDPASEKTYWMKLYDLAYGIYKVLDNLKNGESEIKKLSDELNSINIYLSEVGSDLIAQRDSVKRELLRNGYKVLPEKNMPGDLVSIMKLVREDLASSNMSIHLIGSDPRKISGTNTSIIEIQNRLAAEHFIELKKTDTHSSLNFGRVTWLSPDIWMSPDLVSISVKQRLFIETLRKDAESTSTADLMENTIEELKSFVITKIQHGINQQSRKYNGKKPSKEKIIYVINDKSEAGKSKKIEDFLETNGYNVITSDFKGTPKKLRARHANNLRKCDAALIYYGKENEGWIKSRQNELLKYLGLGRDKPISPQAIIIEDKLQLLNSLEIDKRILILQDNKRVISKVMEPFLAKLNE